MIPKAIPMEIRHIVFLLIFFILYVIFGGIIFMLLEWPYEQIKRKEIEQILNEFIVHIKQFNNNNNNNNNHNHNHNHNNNITSIKLNEQNFRTIIHELLLAKDQNLIDNFGNKQSNINWSFINSFFFAITIITTIGYGHLTPSTIMGKIFCIFYALFGIPITSLLIGSVADRFGKIYSPKKLPRGLHRHKPTYQRQLSNRFKMLKHGLISLVPWFFAFLIVPAWIFRHLEDWSFLDGFYYCFITLSTIGFGDFVAGVDNLDNYNFIWIYKIIIVFWIIFGLAYLSMILNFITNALRSRRISNVMNSLRVKINNSNNNGGILRKQQQHLLRQRSTQNMFQTMFNDHEKFIHNLHYNNNNINNNSSILYDTINDNEQIKYRKKMNLFHVWKIFKSKKKKKQRNNDIKFMRQTTSLPELSECIVRTQQIATITIV